MQGKGRQPIIAGRQHAIASPEASFGTSRRLKLAVDSVANTSRGQSRHVGAKHALHASQPAAALIAHKLLGSFDLHMSMSHITD